MEPRRFITAFTSSFLQMIRNRALFYGEELLAPRPSQRTASCRLSATAYSIYSQPPSILKAVPPSATDMLSRNVANYQSALPNISDERRSETAKSVCWPSYFADNWVVAAEFCCPSRRRTRHSVAVCPSRHCRNAPQDPDSNPEEQISCNTHHFKVSGSVRQAVLPLEASWPT